tara:strand:- start:2260 stop:2925 length:666 start_codon:yes stop_codon:yes gene_type:complete
MEKNKILFEKSEANKWFRRNRKFINKSNISSSITTLSKWLKPFEKKISNILEIGCGTGHNLNQLSKKLKANGFGIDPSSEAVNFMTKKFPKLKVKVGSGDKVPFLKKFDLVHLGFFLYLVDRKDYLKCVSEADRLLNSGGFLSIIDFDTPFPYSNSYSHLKGVFSHKKNNSEVFVSSGLYSLVSKFQYSQKNFFFNKNIDERISISLLYKETKIFRVNKKK